MLGNPSDNADSVEQSRESGASSS
eukprot:SAG31_NODE_21267_length_553_cov_1.585903_1_plen_23_part_10